MSNKTFKGTLDESKHASTEPLNSVSYLKEPIYPSHYVPEKQETVTPLCHEKASVG